MTAADDQLHVVTGSPTKVTMRHIAEITTYQVMEGDLDQLDDLVAAENQSLAFFSLSGGVFAGTLGSALTSWPKDEAVRVAVLLAILFVSLVATGWFGVIWNRARKRRPKLLAKIKGNAAPRSE